MSAALLPIPPEIESGAMVFELDPISTAVLKSDVSINVPLPLGVIVKLLSETVDIVEKDPPPRFKVVAEIPRVDADVIVVSVDAVIVSPPESVRSPSFASINRVIPEDEAAIMSPPVVLLFMTKAATADSVAQIATLSLISTAPPIRFPEAVSLIIGF